MPDEVNIGPIQMSITVLRSALGTDDGGKQRRAAMAMLECSVCTAEPLWLGSAERMVGTGSDCISARSAGFNPTAPTPPSYSQRTEHRTAWPLNHSSLT